MQHIEINGIKWLPRRNILKFLERAKAPRLFPQFLTGTLVSQKTWRINAQKQTNDRIQLNANDKTLLSPISYIIYIYIIFFCFCSVDSAQRHISDAENIKYVTLLCCSFPCLFHFTVETLSQPIPKSSCDFVWSPQLTMLPLKNSSLHKATLTSTHQTSKHTHNANRPHQAL